MGGHAYLANTLDFTVHTRIAFLLRTFGDRQPGVSKSSKVSHRLWDGDSYIPQSPNTGSTNFLARCDVLSSIPPFDGPLILVLPRGSKRRV